MTKYDPSRDIPTFARELKSVSPSKIAAMVLNKRNEQIHPEAVTNWFRRHPQVEDELRRELIEGLPDQKQIVYETDFQNGNFQEFPSVKEWILFMRTRRRKGKSLKPEYIEEQLRLVRAVCKEFQKHPDRLSYHDAQEIFMALETQGKDSCCTRRALKDFLKSKGSPDWEKIGVGKPRGFGKYKTLFVEKDKVLAMLSFIRARNAEVYALDKVMYHNGLRLNAIFTSKIENFKHGEEWSIITVLEKFREEKTFMLIKEVGDLIKEVIGDRTQGLIFTKITERNINELNREAIKEYAPELEPKIEFPSHFFRHMCAQHLLKVTDGNSRVVAAIMQCTEQSLNESYGGALAGDVKTWCMKYLPQLS